MHDNPKGAGDECAPFAAGEQDRSTERAVLAFLINEHPEHSLTVPEAVAALNEGLEEFDPGDSAERAIRELVGSGLLEIEPRHGHVVPTRAAMHFDRLERN